MKKQLELDEITAKKLYKTAAPEFKELLEQNFGKEFFSQKITERVNNYNDILEISGVSESDDNVSIKGFDESENKVLKNIIKKMRIVKVYNEGWLPKRGDRRHYAWWDVRSGFAFNGSSYDGSFAHTTSASRLSFKSSELVLDAAKKFKDVDEAIIDIH